MREKEEGCKTGGGPRGAGAELEGRVGDIVEDGVG